MQRLKSFDSSYSSQLHSICKYINKTNGMKKNCPGGQRWWIISFIEMNLSTQFHAYLLYLTVRATGIATMSRLKVIFVAADIFIKLSRSYLFRVRGIRFYLQHILLNIWRPTQMSDKAHFEELNKFPFKSSPHNDWNLQSWLASNLKI